MKLVSVTIAHNREHAIAGALACVAPYVHEILILDTGITDATIDNARALAATYGVPLHVRAQPWTEDFSAARNAVLDFAADRGADWALMIDTDQRLVDTCPGTCPADLSRCKRERGIVHTLETTLPHVAGYTVRSNHGRFCKEQIFRVPRQSAYNGRTHEAFPVDDFLEHPTLRVSELRKSPEEMRAKLTRDHALLTLDLETEPGRARWWFYLGEVRAGLSNLPPQELAPPSYSSGTAGWLESARNAYARAFHLSRWSLEIGWCAYRCAQLSTTLGDLDLALSWCERGYRRVPEMTETSNHAAWICHMRQDYEACLLWAQRAIVVGAALRARGSPLRSTGFQDLGAYFEEPAGLAALASGALSRPADAALYETQRLALLTERKILLASPSPSSKGLET